MIDLRAVRAAEVYARWRLLYLLPGDIARYRLWMRG